MRHFGYVYEEELSCGELPPRAGAPRRPRRDGGAPHRGVGPAAAVVRRAATATAAGPQRTGWIAWARRGLVRDACVVGGRFRRCTEVDRDACETVLARSFRRCERSLGARLPPRVDGGATAEQLRDTWMGCVWHHAGFELGPARVDVACLFTPE
ncbi:MAG: hypothetical protein U0168_06285 [Nannocystaceae bacterium]